MRNSLYSFLFWRFRWLILFISGLFLDGSVLAQLTINEGSNKNYSTVKDEEGEYQDWIEIFNAGSSAVDLFNYSLSDGNNPGEWTFPHQILPAGEYLLVFCSGKGRASTQAFTSVFSDTIFIPAAGWNTHRFSSPFYWDGQSSILVNLCVLNKTGYTNNSVHLQSETSFKSSLFGVLDGGPACNFNSGGNAAKRPNIRLNNTIIGNGNLLNTETEYPAPYGNWYWSAKHQLLFRAEELSAAGLTAGNIDSLSFSVLNTFPAPYSLIEISMANTGIREMGTSFIPPGGNLNHTSFGISAGGETIRLYDPAGVQVSWLKVNSGPGYDVSNGSFPDGSLVRKKFYQPTPGFSNNSAQPADSMARAPVFSSNSGIFQTPISVSILNPAAPGVAIYYSLDGSDPDTNAQVWNGTPIFIFQSTVLRARAFKTGFLPSLISSASYLFNVSHTTPVISVISDPDNLSGPNGMFDNPSLDLLKSSSIDYFDSSTVHNLLFSRRAGIIMDGGWGSRGLPQRPFRIKFDDAVLGEGPVSGNIIPGRPGRNQFSNFYLRNGSNQFLILPYKDAAQVKMMGEGSQNYYSAWRPVSVYINGQYWGLYELREKFDKEMFKLSENATESSIEILSSSAQYGFQLRAVEGDVQHFYDAHQNFSQLNATDTSFWNLADQYFDLAWYSDYIAAEVWMNNADWGFNYNNIKIYRSDSSQNRWRYCLMDMEFGLLPNPSNDYSCSYDLLSRLKNLPSADPNNPHLNIWLKGIQNERFRNYFINRFADLMNSLYLPSRLLAIENSMFGQTVSEMAKEYQRWGDPFNVPAQVNYFYQNHLIFRDELACRPEKCREYLQSNFSLPQQVSLTLDVFPAEAGKIGVSTIKPETYPWDGVYFDGLPVKIEALAAPGYAFSHWEENGLLTDTMNSVFNDTLKASSANFRAHFTSTVGIRKLEHQGVSVYPNPASDKLFIRSDAGFSEGYENIIISDLPGRRYRILRSRSGKNEYSLDVSCLKPGYYLIRIKTADGKEKSISFLKTD